MSEGTTKSESIKPQFNYLHDTACCTDAFDGGHDNIAGAIFDFIESNDGGITIGLEGKWGSGKSTIIELIKQKYLDKKFFKDGISKRIVFIFDAWAHENDPLRRTFLTSLLNYLGNQGWLNNKNDKANNEVSFVTKTINHLKGKTSKSTTISRPSISLIGAIAAFTTLFIFPVGLALFGEKVSILCKNQPCGGVNWGFITSIFLMIFPVFITLCTCLIVNWKKSRKFCICINPKNFFTNFITKDAKTETNTDTIETPNPTSVEFEEIFEKIFENLLLEKETDWKLILILDNLDRINPDETKAILSALQTFLQYQQRKEKKPCFKKVWTIIPYDPEGMRKVWKEKDNENGEIAEGSNYARRMLEKRFQIRFFTPPIVFTGWKQYMLAKLDEAFPSPTKFDDKRNEVFGSIYNIYYQFLEWWSKAQPEKKIGELDGKEVLPISPRDLLIFINQLGTLYRQWGAKEAKIRFENIAIFVLLKTRNPKINIPEFLNSNQVKEKLPESIYHLYLKNDIDWKGGFAVLWFNVPRKRAKVFLIQDEILIALSEANVEKLNEINNENIGVTDAIESIIYSELLISKYQNRGDYLRSVHTIYKSQLTNEFAEKKWVIENLINIFSGEYNERFNSTNADYLLSFWKVFTENHLDQRFFINVKSEFHSLVYTSQKSDSNTKDTDINNWVTGLEYLYNNLSSAEFAKLSLGEEKFPFDNDTDKEDPNGITTRKASLIYSWGIMDGIPEGLQNIFLPEENDAELQLDMHFSKMVESKAFTPESENSSTYPIFNQPDQVIKSIKEAKVIFPEITLPKTILSAVMLLRNFRPHIEDFPTKDHVIQIFLLLYEVVGIDSMANLFDQKPQDNNLLLAYFGHIIKKSREDQESDDIKFLGFLFLIILLSYNDLAVADAGLATQARDFLLNELLTDTLSYPKIMEAFCEAYLECESDQKFKYLTGLTSVRPSAYGFVWLCTLSILEKIDINERNFLLNYLIKNWKEYINQIDENQQEFIINHVIHGRYLDNLNEISLTNKNDSSFNFLNVLTKSQEFKNRHKLKLLASLDNYDTSQWEEILKLQAAVKFLSGLKEKFAQLKLKEKFFIALKSVASEMLSGKLDIPIDFIPYWSNLIDLLPDRETFDKDLYSTYKRNHLQITNATFFDFFGPNLFSRINLENDPDSIISDLIKPQVLSYPVKSGKHIINLFKQCGKRTISRIIDNEIEMATLRQEMEDRIATGSLSPVALDIFNQIIEFLPSNYAQND